MWITNNKTYIALFVGGFVATYLLVPWVKRLAARLGAYDPPSDRRVHKRHIPTLGGLAIALPLYVGIGLLYLLRNAISQRFFAQTGDIHALLLGGFVILLLGVYDDLRGATAWVKFPFQLLAAVAVCALSGPVTTLSVPFLGMVDLGPLAVPVTVLWIVGVTNAFNFIDGIDGLAAGVGLLVCGVNLFVARIYGHVEMMVFAAIMCGSLLAFLRYNFHPASIFLGDAGSLFIGFTIAVISLQSSLKAPTAVAILLPVCVLGYPLLDMALAVTRRFLKGKPLFSSDRSHIHHKLLASGLGHRSSSAVAYGLTVLFTAIGILYIYGRNREAGILLIVVVLVLAFMFKAFGYWDYIRNRLDLSLRRKFRIYNQLQQVTMLKLEEADRLDELWEDLCWLGVEYNLHTIRLRLNGSGEKAWENPTTDGLPERSTREYDLPDADGQLRVSHNGHKDEDIELEQSILLEELSRKLDKRIKALREKPGVVA